jgi:hypothetical protein
MMNTTFMKSKSQKMTSISTVDLELSLFTKSIPMTTIEIAEKELCRSIWFRYSS